jgi:hypothetical protein
VVKSTQYKRKNSFIITQIYHSQYLVEGDLEVKIGCVTDPIIDYANIINGPFIQLGKDFLGKGSVSNIEIISSTKNIMLKVTLYDKEKQI